MSKHTKLWTGAYDFLTQTTSVKSMGEEQISFYTDDLKASFEEYSDVAGKVLVQIYAQTPYGEYEKENLVEKSAVQLLDFGKTELARMRMMH